MGCRPRYQPATPRSTLSHRCYMASTDIRKARNQMAAVITISLSQAPFVYLYQAEQLPEGRDHTLAPASEQTLRALWWNEWIYCKYCFAIPHRGRDRALLRKVLDAYLINGSHKREAVIRGFHLNPRTPCNLSVGFLPLIRNSSEAFLGERSGLPPQPDPGIASVAAAWQSRVRTERLLPVQPSPGPQQKAAELGRPQGQPGFQGQEPPLPPRSCQPPLQAASLPGSSGRQPSSLF